MGCRLDRRGVEYTFGGPAKVCRPESVRQTLTGEASGQVLLSGSEDGTARVWRVPPLEPRPLPADGDEGGGAAEGAAEGGAAVVLPHRGFVTGVER